MLPQQKIKFKVLIIRAQNLRNIAAEEKSKISSLYQKMKSFKLHFFFKKRNKIKK